MQRIIFFDGVCPLCNGFVDFVIKRDKQHQFYFSSLQSEQAQKLLPKQDQGLNSVILVEGEGIFRKSKAALRILFYLGGWWTVLSVMLSVFPLVLRDSVYDLIAKYRYRFFGKFESCRLPKYEEKPYFLE